ncbi:MAG: ATPase, T2SS/T4P/T4SS family, partial [Gammaproteobacteria bacterium]
LSESGTRAWDRYKKVAAKPKVRLDNLYSRQYGQSGLGDLPCGASVARNIGLSCDRSQVQILHHPFDINENPGGDMTESSEATYRSFEDIMNDGEVSEIMVNGPHQIYVEKSGRKILVGLKFKDDKDLQEYIRLLFKSVGKKISNETPYGDATFADGTRLNAILPPIAKQGSILTIRKFMKTVTSIEDLISWGTITRPAADLLIACIRGRLNIFFSGGTGVGKTTTLQILSSYIDSNERIIVIEDTSELRPIQEHTVNLETRAVDENGRGGVTLKDLIRNSLRMRPDRLIFGEARSEEVLDIVNAMATGHDGCLGVMHASSPYDVVARMETMILMSGLDLPLWEVRKMVTSNLNLIVHQERMTDGSKKITRITEVEGLSKDGLHEVKLQDLFKFEIEKVASDGKVTGELRSVIEHYPKFFNKFERLGLSLGNVFAKKGY